MSKCCDNSFSKNARNRIELQAQALLTDEYGGQTVTWATEKTLWAVIEPRTGKEIFEHNQLQSNVSAYVTVRYQTTLANTLNGAKYRLKFGDRLYNILAVMNLADDLKFEGKAYQKIICTEGETS